jgi:transcriptional regulator with XRE-family HTH domain
LSSAQRIELKKELDSLAGSLKESKKDFAKRLGVSSSTLSFWTATNEGAKQMSPGREDLWNLANLYTEVHGGQVEVALHRFAGITGFPATFEDEIISEHGGIPKDLAQHAYASFRRLQQTAESIKGFGIESAQQMALSCYFSQRAHGQQESKWLNEKQAKVDRCIVFMTWLDELELLFDSSKAIVAEHFRRIHEASTDASPITIRMFVSVSDFDQARIATRLNELIAPDKELTRLFGLEVDGEQFIEIYFSISKTPRSPDSWFYLSENAPPIAIWVSTHQSLFAPVQNLSKSGALGTTSLWWCCHVSPFAYSVENNQVRSFLDSHGIDAGKELGLVLPPKPFEKQRENGQREWKQACFEAGAFKF